MGKKRHSIRELSVMGKQISADHAAAANYVSEFADMVAAGNYFPMRLT